MRARVGITSLIGLWVAMLIASQCFMPAAAHAGGARVAAMGGAGVALPGNLSALFLNPAAIAGLGSIEGHASFNLAGQGGGIQQMFAYGEPDQGYGAGVLGYVRSREVTGYDALTGKTMFDASSAWAYAVGKEIRPGAAVGARLFYETKSRDATAQTGWGYRLDLGLLQSLGSRWHVGVVVTNALQSPVHWSGGPAETSPRMFAGGIAYRAGRLDVALDVVGTPASDVLTIRAGAGYRFGDLELLGGAEFAGEDLRLSAGVVYTRGPWAIQYAYAHHNRLHKAGVTIRL